LAEGGSLALSDDSPLPAEELEELNENIVGLIEVIREFKA
jgi:hypothetical protein